MAQVIVAVQMVLEEKFVYKHDVHPLRAVGTEGTDDVHLQLLGTFSANRNFIRSKPVDGGSSLTCQC